jgi:hypothetical protein
MTSFVPSKKDVSRRRSAPQEIFQTFLKQNLSAKVEPPTASSNYIKCETIRNSDLNSKSHFLTLPHRTPVLRTKYNEERKKRYRHSWMQTNDVGSENIYLKDGQCYTNPSIKRKNRVPYYYNELFCKNAMKENNAKEQNEGEDENDEEDDDQISSKP